MTGEDRNHDRMKKLATGLAIAVGVAVMAAFVALSPITNFIIEGLQPGFGLISAAIPAFLATVGLLALVTLAIGDGLIRKMQYMVGGFVGFFFVVWLLIAWAF